MAQVGSADLGAQLAALGIGDAGTYSLAQLPDPGTLTRRTIWATDLYGVGGRMVSEGGFWKPLRPLVATAPVNVATMSTVPLVTPTTLILGNAGLLGLGVTMNITLGMGTGYALPYPGYRQRVVKPKGALGVLNVIATLTDVLTGWADYEFDGTAWRQTASGGLL